MAEGEVAGAMTGKSGPKVGKIPLIAVIGIPAAAYVLWHYMKKRQVSSSAGSGPMMTSSTDSAMFPPGYDPSTGLMTVGAGGISDPQGTTSSVSLGNAGSLTLDAWATAAENVLIQNGLSPLSAISAINAYLAGNALSPEAEKLVNQALGILGAPPDAPTAGSGTTSSTPSAGSTGTNPGPGTGTSVVPPAVKTPGIIGRFSYPGAPIYDTGGLVPGELPAGSAAPTGVPSGSLNVVPITSGGYRYQTSDSTAPGADVGGVSVPVGATADYVDGVQVGWSMGGMDYPLHPVEFT